MRQKFQYSIREMVGRLLKIASPVKGYLTVSTLASIFGNLSHMGLMGFGALLILSCAGKLTSGSPILFGILMVVCGLMIVICRYLEGVASHAGAYKLLASMRIHLFETIRKLAPACLMDRKKGDILNVAVSDIETIEYFFAHTIGPMFTVILLPCVTLGLALFFHPLYAAVLLPIYLIISIVLPLIAMKAGRPIGMRYRTRLGEIKSLVLESVYGIKDIQIFGYGHDQLARVQEQNKKVNRAAHGLTLHRQTVSSTPTFFVYLARILILAVATYLAGSGSQNPVGTVVISFVAVASFSSTFSLTMVVSSLLEAFAAAERLFIIEDTRPEITETEHPRTLGPIESISFENVSFHYAENSKDILKRMNLVIKRGDKVGIVGESGVGKSTVFRLLLRFWNPVSGSIKMNGIPVQQLSLQELHRRIAVLEQDTFLFNGTIAENIALGKPEASMKEIRNAARRAGLHDFISTLPDGYQTQMGQMGARLSGGERQRVGIARVMLVDPDVVVMDEPTSSLDVLHEKELLKTLREEYPDKTLLIISHRMSTLTGCNRIIRLENGTAIEETVQECSKTIKK